MLCILKIINISNNDALYLNLGKITLYFKYLTVEFSGHAANLFQTKEKVLTANHEFTIMSEFY